MRENVSDHYVVGSGSFELRKIEEVNDGSEGFDEFREYNPDIVMTDWNMLPTNGRNLVRSIRED